MILSVVKRDGRIDDFQISKIENAIIKAFLSVDNDIEEDTKLLAHSIACEIGSLDRRKVSVEEIQDLVEQKLMASYRKDVAKAYIIYRNERTKEREMKSDFMKVISKKLKASDVRNQNANVDERSFGGRRGEAASELMRQHALNNCMSEKSKNNHLNNRIYIHDLDSYSVGMHNCLSIPFDDLLANGFNTRQTDVRPAQSVSTAFQLVAVLFQIQSLQQFGKNLCRV